jgi:predicted small lipoprotein YifL
MRIPALLILLALGGALLTGCGQKGPLVLPDETAPTSAPD